MGSGRRDGMDGEGTRILILDDDEMSVVALTEYLRFKGQLVDCVAEVGEAEAMLDRWAYGLMLADPDLDGTGPDAVLALLRRTRLRHPSTRFIVATGYGSAGLREQALDAGADECVEKPASVKRLGDLVVGRLSLGVDPDRSELLHQKVEAQ